MTEEEVSFKPGLLRQVLEFFEAKNERPPNSDEVKNLNLYLDEDSNVIDFIHAKGPGWSLGGRHPHRKFFSVGG